MQGGRDGSGFGDPFGSFNGFSGFGGQRSLMSSFFGGRDPFDDPFFTRPFGSMFGSNFFESTGGPFMNVSPRGPFLNANASGFLEHQPSLSNISRGPVIEELNSDDEKDENESGKERKVNSRKHGRSSKEPIVEDPDDEAAEFVLAEKKSKHMPRRNDLNLMHCGRPQPQTHSFTFQSSSVTYGGANGAYQTSSSTRRTGSDGLTLEERKEANSTTGQATHRISRGIHEKGHSFTRKLNSDGHVDTTQTLHNLNEDELGGFEEAWTGNARKHLPGWSEGVGSRYFMGSGGSNQQSQNRGGWALPSTERSNNIRSLTMTPDSGRGAGFPLQQSGRMKTDISDRTLSGSRSNGTGYPNQVNRR